jgi:hypothetical protein
MENRERILFAAFAGWGLGFATVCLLIATQPGDWHALQVGGSLGALFCGVQAIRSLLR